jgi:hypothetical protein
VQMHMLLKSSAAQPAMRGIATGSTTIDTRGVFGFKEEIHHGIQCVGCMPACCCTTGQPELHKFAMVVSQTQMLHRPVAQQCM